MGNEKDSVLLRPIDADHFWYGDVMVDLYALQQEARELCGRARPNQFVEGKHLSRAGHALSFNLTYLWTAAGELGTDNAKWYKPEQVGTALKALNDLGLHTGVKVK